MGAARVPFLDKDPRGWQEFAERLGEHTERGMANTMRGVQALRSSLYDLEERLSRMAVPTLIIAGDEDDHTLNPGVYLKRTIPTAGLLVLPKTGHTINLEEPGLFNGALAEFFARVEAGRWGARDPRVNPKEIMKTR
jgi:pimeloyl-ACP methyl ester carboxylesterase